VNIQWTIPRQSDSENKCFSMFELLSTGKFHDFDSFSCSINFRSQKENLKLAEAQEEQRLLRVQKNYIELEMRKFRRKKMILLHDIENQLLRDVCTILQKTFVRRYF
jgi:hypothetical protein